MGEKQQRQTLLVCHFFCPAQEVKLPVRPTTLVEEQRFKAHTEQLLLGEIAAPVVVVGSKTIVETSRHPAAFVAAAGKQTATAPWDPVVINQVEQKPAGTFC